MQREPTRVLLERLVDELDELERVVWAAPDHAELREQLDESMRLACAALDRVSPIRQGTLPG